MATRDPRARIAEAFDARGWLGPLALFVLGAVVYAWLSAGRLGPIVDNDEYRWGNLAQSLANGDGYTWRGAGSGVRTIYPYLVAPAWVFSDGNAAYGIAKDINAVLLSATVWPVWRAARELVGLVQLRSLRVVRLGGDRSGGVSSPAWKSTPSPRCTLPTRDPCE